jgi:tRNA (guanine37-N1)-methyltransferase
LIFDVITIFPEFFDGILSQGLLKRAIETSRITVRLHNLRDFTDDPHRSVDDRPFGGGPGMVLKPEPLFRAVEAIRSESSGSKDRVILLSPQGQLLNQRLLESLGVEPRLVLICGRYEGVDERVAQHLATDEISIGDYVLSGGEVAAAVVMEGVSRLLPGVLGNSESALTESFAAPQASAGIRLDFPQFTRPARFRDWETPEVLLSGDHGRIQRWREAQALAKTQRNRPDLLDRAGTKGQPIPEMRGNDHVTDTKN